MSLNKKTITYMSKQMVRNMAWGIEELGRFPSGIGDNGEVSLNRKSSAPSRGRFSLQIFIKKTNKLPMQVDMELTIQEQTGGPISLTQSSNDWHESIYFSGLQYMNSDRSCTITLSITWTLPESLVWSKPSASTFLGLSNFTLSSTLSDVTILIDDAKIFAHKIILGASSPVLLAAMTLPMKEAAENCIVIKDIEAEVMKAVLRFLYTGNDEDFDDFEMAMKVLMVAEKYAMEKLKSVIEEKLLKCVTIDNALEILDHADTYRSETLKKASMKFIIEHRDKVVHQEYFDTIIVEKPLLMKEFTLGVIHVANQLFLSNQDDYDDYNDYDAHNDLDDDYDDYDDGDDYNHLDYAHCNDDEDLDYADRGDCHNSDDANSDDGDWLGF